MQPLFMKLKHKFNVRLLLKSMKWLSDLCTMECDA